MTSHTIEPLDEHVGRVIRSGASRNILALDAEEVAGLFKTYGLLLFRGFRLDEEKFRQFTAQFSAEFIVHRNSLRRRVSTDGTTQTVQADQSSIPFHGEMYYVPNFFDQFARPDILWFYCVRPALRRGETIICDGVRVLSSLSEPTGELFRARRIRYSHRTSAEVWRRLVRGRDDLLGHLSGVEGVANCRFDTDDTLFWDYHISAIQKTRHTGQDAFVNSLLPPSQIYSVGFEDGSEITQDVRDEILSVTERLTVPLKWQADDLAMIDNTRFMHGRYLNDERRLVYVRMSKSNL